MAAGSKLMETGGGTLGAGVGTGDPGGVAVGAIPTGGGGSTAAAAAAACGLGGSVMDFRRSFFRASDFVL